MSLIENPVITIDSNTRRPDIDADTQRRIEHTQLAIEDIFTRFEADCIVRLSSNYSDLKYRSNTLLDTEVETCKGVAVIDGVEFALVTKLETPRSPAWSDEPATFKVTLTRGWQTVRSPAQLRRIIRRSH